MSQPTCCQTSAVVRRCKTSMHPFRGKRTLVRRNKAAHQRTLAGMEVPSDVSGGKSPEHKAAEALQTFFTYCAVKIVLAQLGGGGEGGDLPPTRASLELREFIEQHPLKHGDEWLSSLVAQNQLLGMRVMEVREAYVCEDFAWDTCRGLTLSGLKEANVTLLRQVAAERFAPSLGPPLSQEPGDDWDQSCSI